MKFFDSITVIVLETLFFKCQSDIVNSIDSLRSILRRHREENCDLFIRNGNDFNDQIVEHPIAAYMFIKCLVQHKRTILNNENILDDYLLEVDEDDQKAAALSLVRLQETYDLKVEDILDGRLLHFESNLRLTFDDCLLIVNQSLLQLNIESADMWLNACRQLIPSAENVRASMNAIQQLQNNLVKLRGLLLDRKSSETKKTIKRLFPYLNDDAVLMLNEREDILEIKYRLKHNTNLLCQGLRDESHLTGRSCEFQRNPHSWIPFLIERIHEDPQILLYHQILNNREIDRIKKLASNKFAVSKVHRFDSGEPFSSSRRVGKVAWLPSNSSETLMNVYRRVEEVLGLSVLSAEDLQVQNYGVGGHYEVHMDFIDSNAKDLKMPTGDRIATFLIYLNDVDYGGATAFPQLGTAVQPRKGAALTWYNLKSDGYGDYRTMHAACPIVMGTKWIATVWLHEHEQELRRPCSRKMTSQLTKHSK